MSMIKYIISIKKSPFKRHLQAFINTPPPTHKPGAPKERGGDVLTAFSACIIAVLCQKSEAIKMCTPIFVSEEKNLNI